MKPVISTSIYGGKFTLTETLELINHDWKGFVELSWVKSAENLDVVKDFNFDGYVMHNYFPPPKEPFLLNIISSDEKERHKSLEFVKENLKLCNKYDFEQYHVHSGYLSGGKATKDGIIFDGPPISQNAAGEIISSSLKYLDKMSLEYDVDLLIENNTAASIAMGDVSDYVVFTNADNYKKYWEEMETLGILLDFGHLKVSANMLNIKLDDEIIKFSKLPVRALHIHDNLGKRDEHAKIEKDSWFLKYLNKDIFPKARFVINEAHLSKNDIIQQINMMKDLIIAN